MTPSTGFPDLLSIAFDVVLALLPLVLPVLLGFALFSLWVDHARRSFFAKQKYTVLEIRLPKEIERTPAAMELFMVQMNQTGGESTWYDRYWLGKTRPWFSFELVSKGGDVHFYIWTRKAWKPHIERNIYSQYPNVEILEVDDYTFGANYNPGTMNAWGCEFALTKDDAYPIKTYVDYGLADTNTDEIMKIDPITPVIEYLGSIERGGNVWIQIVARGIKEKEAAWKDQAKKAIGDIMAKKEGGKEPVLENEQNTITALKRSVSKPGFDVGIRAIYFADKDSFDGINVSGLTGIFKQFSAPDLNGFKPDGGMTVIKFPWHDIGGKTSKGILEGLFDSYKRRGFFYPPYESTTFVLNTEELATIFHFPGSVSQTPTFRRVPSRKAEPPPNLPV